MSALRNGSTNGEIPGPTVSKRFSDIPASIEIPVGNDEDDEGEAVELDAAELGDDPREVCQLLEQEQAARTYWMTVALAYAKQRKMDHAIETLSRGGNALKNNNPREKLSMIGCLCWMYLWKSREAPRVTPEGALASEIKTKDHYLQLATSTINEAARINPGFPPLFLARGVLLLLRASLQTPSKSTAPGAIDTEKATQLKSALRWFEEAIRVSNGKNMLAIMGKARALYSLRKYSEALSGYQEVLQKMPGMVDPDPRLGIGCCFWQLGHKEDAKAAWERCLEINPESNHANILLGLFYLDSTAGISTNSPEFLRLYKKAMTEYTQKSFKLNKDLPLTCVTFANYFLSRKSLANVDSLAHRAIQYTDVNAVASDGWYLLARKEHYEGNVDKAANYYRRADDARGGTDRGYLPAKFGVAQLSVEKKDLGEAKLMLEKILQQNKNYEAMSLLGTIYAEEVFASQYADGKDDKSAELKKAMTLLENVRTAWKDARKGHVPDTSLLLTLARLYETENPERALQCLQQVEQLEQDQIPQSEYPTDTTDESAIKAAIRKLLPPQLLNNIGCFFSQAEKHEQASQMFEAALGACMRISETNEGTATDGFVTTISFNLGRSYESRGMTDQAVEVYERLLARHEDYTDARSRLAYIKLWRHPTGEGPNAVSRLFQENKTDLEVRALYGWYMGKVHSRKRPANISEDDEFRHYKHTLQNHDKHDRYALVGMGNLYLIQAREMRRETEQEKQKRSATYCKAVEFFDKALSLDPKNAYAAQGIAIALVEDQKDYKSALPIFLKVRETVKEPHVFVNLGHIYVDLKQYAKAIESYETALSKEGRANDSVILACLGRAWLSKGRAEKDLDAHSKALHYAQKALAASPEQVHSRFNVAFVQIQQATTVIGAGESHRTLDQLESASAGLEAAITALDEIAVHPQTPYPKHDVEQRANMARNTLRKQLERQLASQTEYEERNKGKLQAALEQRQAELRRREEERQKALELEQERRERLRKEREEIRRHDEEMAARLEEEERKRIEAEMTTDSETGAKVKRKRKPAPRAAGEGSRKRGGGGSGGGGGGGTRKKKKAAVSEGDESEGARPTKKKRRLAVKETNKYKSAEIIVDSDEENEDDELERAEREMEKHFTPESGRDGDAGSAASVRAESGDERTMDIDRESDGAANEEEDDDAGVASRRQAGKRARRGRVVDSDEEDESGGGAGGGRGDKGGGEDEGGEEDEDAGAKSADEEDRRVVPKDEDGPVAADTSMADVDGEDG